MSNPVPLPVRAAPAVRREREANLPTKTLERSISPRAAIGASGTCAPRSRTSLGYPCEIQLGLRRLALRRRKQHVTFEVISIQHQGTFVNRAVGGRLDLEGDIVPADRAPESRPLLVRVGSARARYRGSALLQDYVCGAAIAIFGQKRATPFSADIRSGCGKCERNAKEQAQQASPSSNWRATPIVFMEYQTQKGARSFVPWRLLPTAPATAFERTGGCRRPRSLRHLSTRATRLARQHRTRSAPPKASPRAAPSTSLLPRTSPSAPQSPIVGHADRVARPGARRQTRPFIKTCGSSVVPPC